jgi:hypothetical protein
VDPDCSEQDLPGLMEFLVIGFQLAESLGGFEFQTETPSIMP